LGGSIEGLYKKMFRVIVQHTREYEEVRLARKTRVI
jgi:hypothetical protein